MKYFGAGTRVWSNFSIKNHILLITNNLCTHLHKCFWKSVISLRTSVLSLSAR